MKARGHVVILGFALVKRDLSWISWVCCLNLFISFTNHWCLSTLADVIITIMSNANIHYYNTYIVMYSNYMVGLNMFYSLRKRIGHGLKHVKSFRSSTQIKHIHSNVFSMQDTAYCPFIWLALSRLRFEKHVPSVFICWIKSIYN